MFGPFSSKKAKAQGWCVVDDHYPVAQFKPLPTELENRVRNHSWAKQVCRRCWDRVGTLLERPIIETQCVSPAGILVAPVTPPPLLPHAPVSPIVSTSHATPEVLVNDDPCVMCTAPGIVLVQDGDHTLVGVHFMRKFAMHPPMPPVEPPFYLCSPCSEDCARFRRICDNIAERKELGGSRKKGRKPKLKRKRAPNDDKLSGIRMPESLGTMTSPLDRRRKNSYVEVPVTPIPFVLDDEDFDGYQTQGEDDNTPTTSSQFPIDAYGPDITAALADLQALYEVSGNNAGPAWARCTGSSRAPSNLVGGQHIGV